MLLLLLTLQVAPFPPTVTAADVAALERCLAVNTQPTRGETCIPLADATEAVQDCIAQNELPNPYCMGQQTDLCTEHFARTSTPPQVRVMYCGYRELAVLENLRASARAELAGLVSAEQIVQVDQALERSFGVKVLPAAATPYERLSARRDAVSQQFSVLQTMLDRMPSQ